MIELYTQTALQRTASGLKVSDVSFIFWFIFQAQYYIVYLLKDNPSMGTAASAALRIGILFFLILVWVTKERENIIKPKSSLTKLMLFFVIYSGLSLFWSHAPFSISGGYWVIMVSEIVIVYLLVSLGDTDKVAVKGLKGFVLSTLILGLFALSVGKDMDGRLGDSGILHANVLANQFSIAFFCSLYLVLAKKGGKKWLLFSVFLLALIVLSLSKTVIGAIGVVVLWLLLFSRVRKRIKVLIISFIAIAGAFSFNSLMNYWHTYASMSGGRTLETLSGRTFIWSSTWEMIKDHPIIGYGFYSFREAGPQIAEVRLVSAHNDILNVLFNFGLVGLFIFFLAYLVLFKKSIKLMKLSREVNQGLLGFALLVYFAVRSVTEAHHSSTIFILPLLYLLVEWMEYEKYKKLHKGESL